MIKNSLNKFFKPNFYNIFKNTIIPKFAANLKVKVDPLDFLNLND